MNYVGNIPVLVPLLKFNQQPVIVCELWMNGKHVALKENDDETEKTRKFNEQFKAVIAYWFSRLPSRARKSRKTT